jgi:hypothetical protein
MDPKRRPSRKGRHDPQSGKNGCTHRVARARGAGSNSWPHTRLTVLDSGVGLGAAVSTTGTGVPLALDKPKVNGPKGPPGPLAVMDQTEAPSRGPKTAGGQAPPWDIVVPLWRRDSPVGAFNAPVLLRPARPRGGAPS